MKKPAVSVIGLGYIGLPTAVLLATNGVKVLGVDVSEHAVNSVNKGLMHIVEPGLGVHLKEAVDSGNLKAAQTPQEADVFIIAVPTPFYGEHKPDLSYIKSAAQAIAPVLKKGDLIILESTSPIGTTEKLADWLATERPDLTFPAQKGEDADIQLAHCPERVLPGKIVDEMVNNNRIIGGISKKGAQMASDVYRTFVKGEITLTDSKTAELCKLTENSFRDVNIAFANELSSICDKVGVNVWELINLANKHPRVNILSPGCGVGGHCIAVDPWFIVDSVPEEAKLIHMARNINDGKPDKIVEKVKAAITDYLAEHPDKKMSDVTVACLGLAFKPDIDDLRESPAVKIALDIAKLGVKVDVVEPNIKELPANMKLDNIRLTSLDAALQEANIINLNIGHKQFKKDVFKNVNKPFVSAINI